MNSVMHLSFLVMLLLMHFTAVVKADSSSTSGSNACDQALSSPAASSSNVQAYLGFINRHIERSSGQLDLQIADQILNANQFVNPFSNRTDTLSGQIARAISRLDGKINASEWASIQREIQNIIKRAQSADQDRQQKVKETAAVLNPKVTDKHKQEAALLSLRRDFSTVRFKDRIFVSVRGESETLFLYEIVDEKLVFRHKEPVDLSGPGAWQVIDDKMFLVVGVSDKTLHLYQVDGDQLKFVKRYDSGSSVVSVQPTWQMIGDQLFVAAVNESGEALLFEFVEGQLDAKFSQGVAADHSKKPIWHIQDDRAFLIFSNGYRGCALLYEYINNKLEFVDEACGERDGRSIDLSLQVFEGRALIAMGADDTHVHLFELTGGLFKFLTKVPTKGAVYAAPAWVVANGRAFISFGSVDKNLYLYEIVGDQLEPRDEHFIGGKSHASTHWFDVDDRQLLVAITNDKLAFYEFINKKLELRWELKPAAYMVYLQELLGRGRQNFIVGATYTDLYLIKTIDELNKQGGRK